MTKSIQLIDNASSTTPMHEKHRAFLREALGKDLADRVSIASQKVFDRDFLIEQNRRRNPYHWAVVDTLKQAPIWLTEQPQVGPCLLWQEDPGWVYCAYRNKDNKDYVIESFMSHVLNKVNGLPEEVTKRQLQLKLPKLPEGSPRIDTTEVAKIQGAPTVKDYLGKVPINVFMTPAALDKMSQIWKRGSFNTAEIVFRYGDDDEGIKISSYYFGKLATRLETERGDWASAPVCPVLSSTDDYRKAEKEYGYEMYDINNLVREREMELFSVADKPFDPSKLKIYLGEFSGPFLQKAYDFKMPADGKLKEPIGLRVDHGNGSWKLAVE